MAITNLRHVVKRTSQVQPFTTLSKPLAQDITRVVRRENNLDRRYRTAVTDAWFQNNNVPTGPKCRAAPKSPELTLHAHEEMTARYAMALHYSNRFLGQQSYPHEFKNYGGLPLRHQGPYYEFPLLSSGRLYQGDMAPGPRRIVFNSEGVVANIIEHSFAHQT